MPTWPQLSLGAIDGDSRSVWRYRSWLPIPAEAPAVTLGEGGTPLVGTEVVGHRLQLKIEYLQPTGSFKDRGSAVLASALVAAGVARAVEDSSGNAGASLAAYLASVGITLDLFLPRGTPAARVAQARAAGAILNATAATRSDAAQQARDALEAGRTYASHVYSPYFLAGLATLAFELYEDLGRRSPDNVIAPVGHGVLLLGLYHGFLQLCRSGLSASMPRLFGVQTTACAPIAAACALGADDVEPVAVGPTSAVGIAIADPPRAREVLRAVRQTGGAVVAVTERDLERARADLARRGWYVETSSAAPMAALPALGASLGVDDVTVVPLTGSGLKG